MLAGSRPVGAKASVHRGVWSGDPSQITGQALVTARVIATFARFHLYIYRGTGWFSVLSWVSASLKLWRDILFGRVGAIYLVCSRSTGGFLRDTPALLAASFGVRTLVHVHGSDIVDLLANRRISRLARLLYRRCEIVVPSSHLIKPLQSLVPSRICLVENFFASDAFSFNSVEYPDPTGLEVLWNSNIMASKGFFELVDAATILRNEGRPVRLVVIGQALSDNEMAVEEVSVRFAEVAKLPWVEYHGKVTPDTAARLVAASDVTSLLSRMECQPLALIQAMCVGRAIIASDIPAHRATLLNYPATFVPVGSVSRLADALRELLMLKCADPVSFHQTRSAAAADARLRFSGARFDGQMADLLNEVS